MRNLDKTASFSRLDKAVTFCFNHFDVASYIAGMVETPPAEASKWAARADRWWKRAHHYALVRDTLNASGRLSP